MDVNEAQEVRQLREENARLQKLVARKRPMNTGLGFGILISIYIRILGHS